MTVYLLVALFIGIAIGTVFHAFIAKEGAATKSELEAWANRLEHAVLGESRLVGEKVNSIVSEIRQKV